MALILDVYWVEHEALERGIVGKPEHLALRKEKSVPAMEALRAWLDDEVGKWTPLGPMGRAIQYAINNWTELSVFLTDPKVPVDNNKSERAMRVVALGRKNFMTVGHDDAGENLMIWYSLVASREAIAIDPVAYLTDILMKVPWTKPAEYDSLLPRAWAEARGILPPKNEDDDEDDEGDDDGDDDPDGPGP